MSPLNKEQKESILKRISFVHIGWELIKQFLDDGLGQIKYFLRIVEEKAK